MKRNRTDGDVQPLKYMTNNWRSSSIDWHQSKLCEVLLIFLEVFRNLFNSLSQPTQAIFIIFDKYYFFLGLMFACRDAFDNGACVWCNVIICVWCAYVRVCAATVCA